MRFSRYYCFLCFFLLAPVLLAEEYAETLKSTGGDRVTVNYRTEVHGLDATVSILKVSKTLGPGHIDKYNDASRIKALFFDRNGGIQKVQFNSDISTAAISINRDELSYTRSEDGYFWLDERPELHLKLVGQEAQLSIPVYLAYDKKKKHPMYEIFADCGNLNILFSQEHVEEQPSLKSSWQESPESAIIDEEMSPSEQAHVLMDKVNEILQQRDGLKYLDDYTSELRKLELKVTDSLLRRQINDVLNRAEAVKEEAERAAVDASQKADEEANLAHMENEARANLEYLNDRLGKKDELSESDMAKLKDLADELRRKSHSVKDRTLAEQMNKAADQCDEEMKKIEESKKKKNIWMIIGGLLFAILMFIGNQVFQHFRNLRNQKGIAEMQDKMVKRAENEARRRARNAINSKVNQVQNTVIDKSRQTVRNGVRKGVNNITKGKDNKQFKI